MISRPEGKIRKKRTTDAGKVLSYLTEHNGFVDLFYLEQLLFPDGINVKPRFNIAIHHLHKRTPNSAIKINANGDEPQLANGAYLFPRLSEADMIRILGGKLISNLRCQQHEHEGGYFILKELIEYIQECFQTSHSEEINAAAKILSMYERYEGKQGSRFFLIGQPRFLLFVELYHFVFIRKRNPKIGGFTSKTLDPLMKPILPEWLEAEGRSLGEYIGPVRTDLLGKIDECVALTPEEKLILKSMILCRKRPKEV